MDDKIKQLTDKILAEGVAKGKQQAEELIAEAQKKSDEILSSAKQEAEKLLKERSKEADELTANTKSELQLAAAQTLQALKSAIADQLSERLSALATSTALSDDDFLRSLLLKLVGNWSPEEGLMIQTADAQALEGYFKSHAKELLDKGLHIEEIAGRKSGFTLKPSDGSYKVNFGEEELKTLFHSFLRPRLIEILFQ